MLVTAGPGFDPARRKDRLRFLIAVSGTDGHHTPLSWAEIDLVGMTRSDTRAAEPVRTARGVFPSFGWSSSGCADLCGSVPGDSEGHLPAGAAG